ncbi:MAG: TRAP transporter small permease subunit [Paracoccaceae bacterium]
MPSLVPAALGWLQRRAENVIALLLAAMFVTFLYQVAVRYLIANVAVVPVGWTSWTVEFVSIAWLWGILFGYAFVVRDADIIRLDILYNGLPMGVRRAFDTITSLVVAAILAYTLPKVWDYIEFAVSRTHPGDADPVHVCLCHPNVPSHWRVIVRLLLNTATRHRKRRAMPSRATCGSRS